MGASTASVHCDAWNVFANDSESVCLITSRDYARTIQGQGGWYSGIEEAVLSQDLVIRASTPPRFFSARKPWLEAHPPDSC